MLAFQKNLKKSRKMQKIQKIPENLRKSQEILQTLENARNLEKLKIRENSTKSRSCQKSAISRKFQKIQKGIKSKKCQLIQKMLGDIWFVTAGCLMDPAYHHQYIRTAATHMHGLSAEGAKADVKKATARPSSPLQQNNPIFWFFNVLFFQIFPLFKCFHLYPYRPVVQMDHGAISPSQMVLFVFVFLC